MTDTTESIIARVLNADAPAPQSQSAPGPTAEIHDLERYRAKTQQAPAAAPPTNEQAIAAAFAEGAEAERARIVGIWTAPEAAGRLETAIELSRANISVEAARAVLASLPAAAAAAGVTGNMIIDRAVARGSMTEAEAKFLMFDDHAKAETDAAVARILSV